MFEVEVQQLPSEDEDIGLYSNYTKCQKERWVWVFKLSSSHIRQSLQLPRDRVVTAFDQSALSKNYESFTLLRDSASFGCLLSCQ